MNILTAHKGSANLTDNCVDEATEDDEGVRGDDIATSEFIFHAIIMFRISQVYQ